MFALHCANAIIIIIIIAIVAIVGIIIISKRFKNKLNSLADWRFMSIIFSVTNKENQTFIQS